MIPKFAHEMGNQNPNTLGSLIARDNCFDARFMEMRAEQRLGKDARKSKEYEAAADWIYDRTMSCDIDEAKYWVWQYLCLPLQFYGEPITDFFHHDINLVSNADEAAGMFLAALDIYQNLQKYGV